MTQIETERVNALLVAKQTELFRSLHKRDEIAIEKTSDSIDEVQLMEERELAGRNFDRDSHVLRQIERALSRLANSSYGVCMHCEEEIPRKRMVALPWADFCIQCQERADRGEINIGWDNAQLLPHAA